MEKIRAMRMISWAVITVCLLAVMWISAPQLISVDIHKVSLVTLGAWLGYWIDRGLAPYARPDSISVMSDPTKFAAASVRRGLIVSAVVIAVALGA